jgi:CubicO group peptidase (beta-lactamase class C family)
MNKIIPEHVGLSSKRLNRIRPIMQAYIDQKQCAGVITMIARRGQIAHWECVGMMDIAAHKPMTPDAIFRIYSMTKPITSVALMLLYEEGKFRLSDPVSKFIPEFQDTMVFVGQAQAGLYKTDRERDITIHHLLTHTAGLSYGFEDDSPIDALYRDMYKDLNMLSLETHLINPDAEPLEHVMPALARIPLVHQPGSAWHYSFAIDVLGYLVEMLSGERFDAFLQRRVFEPLEMVDTGFYVPEAKVDRFTTMYKPGESGGLEVVDAPVNSPYTKPQNFLSGGGGLVSTASDYLQFAQMLLNKGELDGVRLLSRKTVEFMTRNHLSDDVLRSSFGPMYPGYGFGLGWSILLNVAQSGSVGSEGSFGWGGAAGTDFWVDPKEELIGLIMPQIMNDRSSIRDDFKVLTYQAIID